MTDLPPETLSERRRRLRQRDIALSGWLDAAQTDAEYATLRERRRAVREALRTLRRMETDLSDGETVVFVDADGGVTA